MTFEERSALEAEAAALRRKVEKRRNMPGFLQNVADIDARIYEIETRLAAGEAD